MGKIEDKTAQLKLKWPTGAELGNYIYLVLIKSPAIEVTKAVVDEYETAADGVVGLESAVVETVSFESGVVIACVVDTGVVEADEVAVADSSSAILYSLR